MQPGALRALEWDQIVDVVRGFALTPLGAARLAELEPQSDPHRVAQLLAATTEGVKYLDANPAFSLKAPDDLDTRAVGARGRRARARPAAAAGVRGVSRFARAHVRHDSPRQRRLSRR